MNRIYSLETAGRIVAGINSIEQIGMIVRDMNIIGLETIAIITDPGVWKAGLTDKPRALLEDAGYRVKVIHHVPSEPEIGQVKGLFEAVKDVGCQFIVGIGGGSVMDVAKILAAMLTNAMDLEDMIGTGKIPKEGLPTLMVPTTAGTGSEATPNAIVTIPEQELKVGIVSSRLLPDCVILDPCMTLKLPPSITASTGMDALTHALECFISTKANPISDALALRAIRLIARSIRKACSDGSDMQARHDMLLGSFFGGMCIASSGTAAVHALAYPLGGKYRIPHGVSNAMLLPYVMAFNKDAVIDKLSQAADEMGVAIGISSAAEKVDKLVEELHALCRELGIPSSLSIYGIKRDDVEVLVEGASKVTRLLDNNPKAVPREAMADIYSMLL